MLKYQIFYIIFLIGISNSLASPRALSPLCNLILGDAINSPDSYDALEAIVKNYAIGNVERIKSAENTLLHYLGPAGGNISALHETLASPNGIIFFPDSHGDPDIWKTLVYFLQSGWSQWLAIEAPEDIQPIFNLYKSAPLGTVDFALARSIVKNYFSSSWDLLFRKNGRWNSPESPIEILLFMAKVNNVAIMAIDASDSYRTQGNIIELIGPAKVITRNIVWGKNISQLSARGMVLGGGAHFLDNPGANVQDFFGLSSRPHVFLDMLK